MSVLSIEEGTQVYSDLKATVVAEGILDRSYVYYFFVISLTFAGFFASLASIYLLDSYLLLALACISFSFFSVQVAGVNHDSGHRAVFDSLRFNNVLGLVCSGLLGIVFDNWRTRHNLHHSYSNQIGKDPDLEVPFIATDPALAANKSALQRAVLPFQHLYYFPLGSIVSFSNRLGSMSYFLHRRSRRDLGRLAIYLPAIFVLFVLPFLIFAPEKALFVFFTVHITSGIYLMNCFAPNHKGMDVIAEDAEMSFIEKQVTTSRNVKGGLLTDIVLVGLNHQVEHHLFPHCPRNKLHRIRPHLVAACERSGIPFVESGIIETNRDILRNLRDVARSLGTRADRAPIREEAAESS